VCGTPRIFEELDQNPKYVFRTMGHAAVDGIALARYVATKFPDSAGYTGINQNYAWGQDSWRDYDLAMKVLMPNAKASESPQWPKLFAGQYGAEISALMLAKEPLVHSSFWGGDLEAFIFQATPRLMFQRKKVMLTVAGTAVYRLNEKMPSDIIIGARGPYGIFAETIDTPLNKWFISEYMKRYNTGPTGPSYQYAQAVLGAKVGYEKAAAANGGKFPTTDQVIAAMEGMEYEGLSTKISLALGKGHQAITEHVYGITDLDKDKKKVVLKDVVKFPAECVSPPEGTHASEWIKAGMPGAKC
jgi:branched-chain amino acid transport system substrate-binding protein